MAAGCAGGRGCSLTDRKGVTFPLACGSGGTELLNAVPLYLADRLSALPPLDFLYLHFTDETPAAVSRILRDYRTGGGCPAPSYTRGLTPGAYCKRKGPVMRSEQEMMDLILGVAKADGRIRAAYLNGSRANPRVAKDPYRDYDVVYVVEETASFLADKGWISVFGEPAIVQEPDSNDLGWGIGHDFSRSYTWLMLFTDFTRIDLHIETAEAALEGYGTDTLTLPLLDKDGILLPCRRPTTPVTGFKGRASPITTAAATSFGGV